MANITRSNGRAYNLKDNYNRFLTPDEYLKFEACLKKKQKFSVRFLINTGARINEARNVKVNDIYFKSKKIILRVVKARSFFALGKVRFIPISSKFVRYLKNHIADNKLSGDDYLCILSNSALNTAYKKAAKLSRIKDYWNISSHTFRKTLETWLVSLNVTHIKLCSHFGHDKSTALKHYISPDTFSRFDRDKIRGIIGNLYYGDGKIDVLYDKIQKLEAEMERLLNKKNG